MEFELRRMSGKDDRGQNEERGGRGSYGSRSPTDDDTGSIDSIDMEGDVEELEMDEEMIKVLAVAEDGERMVRLAVKAVEEGRPHQADALVAAAYERNRC